jgi:hypothetical protein
MRFIYSIILTLGFISVSAGRTTGGLSIAGISESALLQRSGGNTLGKSEANEQ